MKKRKTDPMAIECVNIMRMLIDNKLMSKADLERHLGMNPGYLQVYFARGMYPTKTKAATMLPKLRRFSESKPVKMTVVDNSPEIEVQNGVVVNVRLKKTPQQETIFIIAEKLAALLKEIETKQAEYEKQGQELIEMHAMASKLESTMNSLRTLFDKGA